MNEKEKYLSIYKGHCAEKDQPDIIPGKIGGGYGRICWGENMLEPLKKWKVSSLLDVGCGYGNFCDAATLFVPRVFGLDIASVATGNVIDNPEITYLDGEAKSLPLPQDSVEWITSFDCLEHCLEEDIDEILEEFNRVASRGFVLSISYEPCEMDGMPLHMTVRPEAWWINKLSRYGQVKKQGRAPITGAPYLICRKPVDPQLICYCAGALGSRLRALAWANELAGRSGRRLTMLWLEKDPLCRIEFSALFVNPIPEISEDILLKLPSCKIYAHVKEVADQVLISNGKALRKIVQKWGCSELGSFETDDGEENIVIYAPQHKSALTNDACWSFIRQLSPTAPIQARIQSIVSRLQLDKRYMGVHARCTDFGIDVEAYAHQMKRAIRQNQDQKFLVCSEDKAIEHKLEHRFQGRVVIRPKSSWVQKLDANQPWAIGNIITSQASVIEALIDLYLLAHTDMRIYHESSAYAQVAAILSKGNSLSPTASCKPTIRQIQACAPIPIRLSTNPDNQPAQPVCMAHLSRNTVDTHQQCPIYYFCPDIRTSSAGIRRLYRHVALLHNAGFPAFILHEKNGFQLPDMPWVPITYLDRIGPDDTAIFVIPEGMPRIMHRLKNHPGRRFAIALSWHYIFSTLPDGLDWRHLNIERVLVISPVIGRLINWTMGLPVHQISSSIDHQRYFFRSEDKRIQIAYIGRKTQHVEKIKRLLCSRNPDYIHKIKWMALENLSQDDYAAQIRQSSIFLTTSMAEGFPTSCLEAMAAGTIVTGYAAVGGNGILCSDGVDRNCILAPNGDYVSLAYDLAPLLEDLIQSRMDQWNPVIIKARQTASAFTLEKEAGALIRFWLEFNTRQTTGDPDRPDQTPTWPTQYPASYRHHASGRIKGSR